MPECLHTDEWIDVASSLDHLGASLRRAKSDSLEWKWAVIASHNVLQGALVCVLQGTAGLGCLSDSSARKMIQWFEDSRHDPKLPRPQERLAELPVLLNRSYSPGYMGEFGGAPLPRDEKIDQDIRRPQSFRNQFMHFRPVSWSIEITGLPRMIGAALRTAWRLMFGHPASMMRLTRKQRARLARGFREISAALSMFGVEPLPRMFPRKLVLGSA